VWELWDAGLISDEVAEWAWLLIYSPQMSKDHANAGAFIDYVEKYMNAYGDIAETSDRTPARVQVVGQAVELAFKGYLAATCGNWPLEHDLMKLRMQCEAQGLKLTEDQRDSVVPTLNALYHRPGSENWRYPSRYPNPGLNVWVIPGRSKLTVLVDSIVDQTRQALASS